MAVTAKFLADFSSFSSAVDKAETKLTEFRTESAKVEGQLKRMGDSFSGKKILSDATLAVKAVEDLGGASKLTASEQQRLNATVTEAIAKYHVLGQTAPQSLLDMEKATHKAADSLQAIPKQLTLAERAAGLAKSTFGQMFGAFTAASIIDRGVSSLINFGKAALESASQTADLSAKLGVSTDAIQKWEFVAKQTGSTVEEFSSSAFKLGVRLGGGSDSVKNAVEGLGLSFQKIQQLKPEAQFDTVVGALGRMNDATKRNELGVAIFGKNFEGIAAAVAQGYEDIAKGATISTAEQIKALDDAGDEWEKLTGRIGKATQGALASILKFSNSALAGILFEGNRKPTGNIEGLLDPRLTQESVKKLDDYVQKLKAAKNAVAALTPETRKQIDAALELGTKTEDLADRFGLTEEVLSLYKSTLKDTSKTTKDAAKDTSDMQKALAAFLSEANNAEGLKRMNADLAVLQATSSKATKDMQALGIAAKTAAVQSQLWNQGGGLLGGLMQGGPANLKSQNVSAGKAAGVDFFSGFTGGFKDLWAGMSGGKGIGGMLSGVGAGISQGFGNLISGGLTSLIGGGISALGKGISSLFGKLTGREGKQVNDLRDAAIAAAGGFEALNTKAALAGTSLEKLLSTKKVNDYNEAWKDLQGTLDEYAADQERLQAAIEKYGFSLEELGPTLQKQELDKQAKELIEDWRVLVAAGIDIVTVNEKMAETVQAYLSTAIKVGAEVPAAMKPILQSMIDQGTLVDENGEAITDLEKAGVKFSETMTEGFDRVVKKLDELIDRLQSTGVAIANIPSSIDIATNYRPGQLPIPDYQTADYPAFATGTRGRFLDFKSGTPVMLHGRERVMTEAESRTDTGALDDIAAALGGIDRRISTAVSRAVTDALILAPGWR